VIGLTYHQGVQIRLAPMARLMGLLVLATIMASGDGVSQVDVVAVEGSGVVLSMAIDRATDPLAVLPSSGAKLPVGAVDGLWMAPQMLAELQTGSLGGLLVLRGDYPLNGTTYQAISVVNPTPDEGTSGQSTYDVETGVLLGDAISLVSSGADVVLGLQRLP